jgi:two-component system response regulator FixJ
MFECREWVAWNCRSSSNPRLRLPIIVMSLKGGMETAARVMKAGAVDFIEKPFNDEGLLGAINAALALPRRPPHDRGSIEAAKRIARLSPRER